MRFVPIVGISGATRGRADGGSKNILLAVGNSRTDENINLGGPVPGLYYVRYTCGFVTKVA